MKNDEKIKKLEPKKFKRLIGVKPETFEKMVEEYEKHHNEKKLKGGRPNKLSVSSQVLVMLEYYREYRSMSNIGLAYKISEATTSRIIREVESTLIKSEKFSLPSKRALYNENIDLNYILIDVTECPVERPKKSKERITAERKSNIR